MTEFRKLTDEQLHAFINGDIMIVAGHYRIMYRFDENHTFRYLSSRGDWLYCNTSYKIMADLVVMIIPMKKRSVRYVG